jgi:hypothetical protein
MKQKICIIVNRGMVENIFSSSEEIGVEIIDLDSQEEDENDLAEARRLEVESDENLSEIY